MRGHIRIAPIAAALLLAAPLSAQAPGPPEAREGSDYCAACHGGLGGRAGAPVAEWRASVHAGEGRKCSLCHGGDPGVNDRLRAKSRAANFNGRPDRKAVSEFCGREGCHAAALAQFRRGPHYLTARTRGEPACITCHGVHGIRRSSAGVINEESCTACHPAEHARDIMKMVGNIDRGIGTVEKNIAYLAEKHAEVDAVRYRLDNARHMFHQLVHVFSRQEMEFTRRLLETEITGLDAETSSKAALVRRLDLLYIITVGFGVAIIGWVLIYTIVMYSRRRK